MHHLLAVKVECFRRVGINTNSEKGWFVIGVEKGIILKRLKP